MEMMGEGKGKTHPTKYENIRKTNENSESKQTESDLSRKSYEIFTMIFEETEKKTNRIRGKWKSHLSIRLV